MKIFSMGYFLIKVLFYLPYRLFYRNIHIVGRENIPKEGSVIFAPNHSNALMDPLAIVFAIHRQILFLARGDIFKVKLLVPIFHFFKILPVYRARDKSGPASKNMESFEKVVDYFSIGGSLGMFPEAAHNPHRNLLPLRKGVARVSYLALEKDVKPRVKIVPTGIFYSNFHDSQSSLRVEFATPISVDEFAFELDKSPAFINNSITTKLREGIQKCIIDIPECEDYNFTHDLAYFLAWNDAKAKRGNFTETLFQSMQKRVKQIDEDSISESKMKEAKKWYKLLNTSKLSVYEWVLTIEKVSISKIFINGLILPLAIFSTPFLAPLFFLHSKLHKLLVEDQFIASLKFLLGLLVLPFWTIIISCFLAIFSGINVLWVFLLSLSLSYIGYRNIHFWKKQIKRRFCLKKDVDGQLVIASIKLIQLFQ